MKPKFGPMESNGTGEAFSADILGALGENLGCIEKTVQWEQKGASRAWTVVAGTAVYEVLSYDFRLETLADKQWLTLAGCRAAVRRALKTSG